MTPTFATVVTGCMSCFALGWAMGRTWKAVRQFFDHI